MRILWTGSIATVSTSIIRIISAAAITAAILTFLTGGVIFFHLLQVFIGSIGRVDFSLVRSSLAATHH